MEELQAADDSDVMQQLVKPGLLLKFESWGVSSGVLAACEQGLNRGLSEDLGLEADCLLYGAPGNMDEVITRICGNLHLPQEAVFVPAMRRKLKMLGATEIFIDAAVVAVSRRTPADLALWATAPEDLAAIRELRRFFDEALGDEAQLHEHLFRPALQQRFQELGAPTEVCQRAAAALAPDVLDAVAEEYQLLILSPLRRLGGDSASTALPGSCAWELLRALRLGQELQDFLRPTLQRRLVKLGANRPAEDMLVGSTDIATLKRNGPTLLDACHGIADGHCMAWPSTTSSSARRVVSSRWTSSARSWVWRKSCRPCCGQPLWAVCSAWAPRQPRCEP